MNCPSNPSKRQTDQQINRNTCVQEIDEVQHARWRNQQLAAELGSVTSDFSMWKLHRLIISRVIDTLSTVPAAIRYSSTRSIHALNFTNPKILSTTGLSVPIGHLWRSLDCLAYSNFKSSVLNEAIYRRRQRCNAVYCRRRRHAAVDGSIGE